MRHSASSWKYYRKPGPGLSQPQCYRRKSDVFPQMKCYSCKSDPKFRQMQSYRRITTDGPNKLAQAVTLLIYIPEVPSPNDGQATEYPKALRAFPQSLQTNVGKCLKLDHDSVRPHPFQSVIHVFYHSRVYSTRYW
jgi:hypothetical protein